jgi:hypothetical protein
MHQSEDEGYFWYQSLQPYVKNNDVFKTPAYTRKPVTDSSGTYLPFSDYVVNGLFVHGSSLTDYSSPAEQIMVAMRNPVAGDIDYHPWPQPAGATTWDDLNTYGNSTEGDAFIAHIFLRPWNGKGQNFGFQDGHAKFLAWEKSLAGGQGSPGMHNVDRKSFAE